MISAVVLADGRGRDVEQVREIVVRSLVWLVSAVVAGVVRDVNLAVPRGLDLAEVAEHAGCGLIVEGSEADRLSEGGRTARCPRLLVLCAGFQPAGPLIEEISGFERHAASDAALLLHAAPTTLFQRLFPNRAPVVGAVLSAERLIDAAPSSFRHLLKTLDGSLRTQTRVHPIV